MRILKAACVVAVAIAVSAQASALDRKAYAKCAATDGDLSRLDCYDQLAANEGLVKKTTAADVSGSGKWDVSLTTNPVDDSKTVVMSLLADSGSKSRNRPIMLLARCKSNKTELFISWNDYLGRNSMVLTRIGKKKATTIEWALSTDSQATFNIAAIEFLKEMMEADSLVAQVTPYNDSPITAVFDTTGLRTAIKPLQETCGWSS